jgi:integrase
MSTPKRRRNQRRPRPQHGIPALVHHKPSGQARVRIDGQDRYLGKFGSPQARRRYQQIVRDLAAGGTGEANDCTIQTVAELVAEYMVHVRQRYRKHGRPTSEVHSQKTALRFVVALYADARVEDFGPAALQDVREAMIEAGMGRKSINRNIGRIRQAFRWAAERERIDAALWQRLGVVQGLRRGQGGRETAKPAPLAWQAVKRLEGHVAAQVWAMVALQWHTGMRPGEVVIMRTADIETGGPIWLFRPSVHKTEHHDRDRVVAIGPRGQKILQPWLRPDLDAYLFQPREAEAARNAARRAARQSPRWPSHDPARRAKRRRQKPRTLREAYSVDAYRRAIRRGLEAAALQQWRKDHGGDAPDGEGEARAFADLVERFRWSPNQLRHSFATRARKQFDLDPIRAALGHSGAETTLTYARQDMEKAAAVARRIG